MEKGKSDGNRFHFLSRKIHFFHLGEPTTPRFAKLLLNYKIVKTEKQAMLVIYGTIFACYAIVALFMYRMEYLDHRVILRNGQVITVEQYADGLRQGLYK